MDAGKLQQAIELYDRFTHDGMDRRDFFARMTLIAGSAAAATSLIASIAASPAAAAIVAEDDKRLKTAMVDLPLPGIPAYRAYTAELRSAGRRPSVVVVHENRGLNAHTKDVARRLALEGFHVVAPDFLSPAGGTPATPEERTLTAPASTTCGFPSISRKARAMTGICSVAARATA